MEGMCGRIFGQFGSRYQRAWITGYMPGLGHPLKPGANRGQRPGDRCLGQPPAVKFAQVVADLQMIHAGHLDALLGQVGGEIGDLPPIGAESMGETVRSWNRSARNSSANCVDCSFTLHPLVWPGDDVPMYCFQPAQRKMCVDLGGGDVSVAEESLDSPEIGSILHHVSGATVAQHVGTGARPTLHQAPHPLPGESGAANGEEESALARPSRQRRPPERPDRIAKLLPQLAPMEQCAPTPFAAAIST